VVRSMRLVDAFWSTKAPRLAAKASEGVPTMAKTIKRCETRESPRWVRRSLRHARNCYLRTPVQEADRRPS
jgi:hypothetical protein